LAKAGYWSGDVGRILSAPADQVLAAQEYESFMADYEEAYIELNREQ